MVEGLDQGYDSLAVESTLNCRKEIKPKIQDTNATKPLLCHIWSLSVSCSYCRKSK